MMPYPRWVVIPASWLRRGSGWGAARPGSAVRAGGAGTCLERSEGRGRVGKGEEARKVAEAIHNGLVIMKTFRIISIVEWGLSKRTPCIPIRFAPSTFAWVSSKNIASEGDSPSRESARR
jgi:hypothetical protein